MKQITLKAKTRTDFGRTASKHYRENGIIPAVFYGDSGHQSLTVDAHEFTMAYRDIVGRAALLQLEIEGQGEPAYAIIQELQRNPRTDAYLHIDLKEIVRGQEMETAIPVVARGIADGVRNYGGVLEISQSDLNVRCRPRHLPESIEVDVTALEIGKSYHLSELTAPEGVTFLDDPDLVVVSCVGASGGASGEESGEADTVEEIPEAAAPAESTE
jgi:large subunit ribosomal protein L25